MAGLVDELGVFQIAQVEHGAHGRGVAVGKRCFFFMEPVLPHIDGEPVTPSGRAHLIVFVQRCHHAERPVLTAGHMRPAPLPLGNVRAVTGLEAVECPFQRRIDLFVTGFRCTPPGVGSQQGFFHREAEVAFAIQALETGCANFGLNQSARHFVGPGGKYQRRGSIRAHHRIKALELSQGCGTERVAGLRFLQHRQQPLGGG